MESICEDMWTSFKYLHSVIEKSLLSVSKQTIPELETVLRTHKQSFLRLLQNPPKNEDSRKRLLQCMSEGLNLQECGNVHLSKDFVEEALLISDMFKLDEYIALELLCTSQRHMSQHPGLPRGLVAVLLYYDGRKAMACSLRELFQSVRGVSWCTDVSDEVTSLISSFAESIVEESNILFDIIDLLSELDISREMIILTKNRALGLPKHQRQVLDLFQDIRMALATALFNWSAQRGLPKAVAIKVMEYLSKVESTDKAGGISDDTMTVLMALLYAFDTSFLQRLEDNEHLVRNLPVIAEHGFTKSILDFLDVDNNWQNENPMKSIAKFSFGLSLSSLRQAPNNLVQSISEIIESDEQLIDESIQLKVFECIYNLMEKNIIFETEFFYRRIHSLFTDFIDLMHGKVTELRAKADETAKTLEGFANEGLEAPTNLDHSFELLMLSIGKFYSNHMEGVSLCSEYWGPMKLPTSYSKATSRSVSLFKFVRLAGELLPSILIVPYLKMLAGLSCCEQSARNTFNFLKQGCGSITISWDHFFGSLAKYYSSLSKDQSSASDYLYRNRPIKRGVNPQEIKGILAVLELVRTVATYDEIARVAFCENINWSPIPLFLGLLSCAVPLNLKADILLTLAAFAKSTETAMQLWTNLEASQIISTIPTTNTYKNCDLEMEIEQNECRNEVFPLSQATLDLLYSLVETVMPKNLGVGPRKPGLYPYLRFVINSIFLKFYNRTYKNPDEKWKVGEKCLKLINYFIKSYEVSTYDFAEHRDDDPPPGYHIMLQLHTKSDTLRMIFHIIDEARVNIDQYCSFPGKENLENCALHCLNIIEVALSNQNLFFDAHSTAGCSTFLSGLNKIMLDVNPRSGRPDHVLNTTKFITYNSWLPRHSLISVKILNVITRLPNIHTQLLRMFTQYDLCQVEIRHGFVECFEKDVSISVNKREKREQLELETQEAIIDLITNCLAQPALNLAHLLLGFDVSMDSVHKIELMDFPSNCTKSLVLMLDKNLEIVKAANGSCFLYGTIIEKAFKLLYLLCCNQWTSGAILRFLRKCEDFLHRHLSVLIVQNFKDTQTLNQMSYLLRCTAIDLKISAESNQIGRFLHLSEILIGVSLKSPQEDIPVELGHYYTHHLNNDAIKTKGDKKSLFLLGNLLDSVEFESKALTHPTWEFFDNSLTAQILQECEVNNEYGLKLINIKKLYQTLSDELRTVQNTIASGQKQVILKEIESVLSHALNINEQKNKNYATIKFIKSWGEVTEILITCTPLHALSIETKQELILEVLLCVFTKVVPQQVSLELADLLSGTILLLLVNLRYCYAKKSVMYSDQNMFNDHTSIVAANATTCKPPTKCNTLSLKFILRNITEWIIISAVASQKQRLNLYAGLLNFMHVLKQNTPDKLKEFHKKQYVPRLDESSNSMNYSKTEDDNQINEEQITNEVFAIFGEKLIDILCHDCIGGHDICKMTAFSCIDTLLDFVSFLNLMNVIAKRGYLSHIIESLLKSDANLCRLLRNTSENIKAIYVYESKIAMLTKFASFYVGAELLLEGKIIDVLSRMKVFDMHPDFSSIEKMQTNEFVPAIGDRYRQILLPALSFCDAIISTLGRENRSAVSHVIHFLLSHGDMIEVVLRAGTPVLDLGLLQEISGVTGLIARTTTVQDSCVLNELDSNQNMGVYFFRLQRLLISLIPRFTLNSGVLKDIFKSEDTLSEQQNKSKSLHIKIIMEIASNLVLYCRNAITNHLEDYRAKQIIFSPDVTTLMQRNENQIGTTGILPNLGIVFNQLKHSVEYYNKQKFIYNNLHRQRSLLTVTSIDASALDNFFDLCERLSVNENELNHSAFIMEQCLFILWTHLDFFIRRLSPLDNDRCSRNVYEDNNSVMAFSSHANWRTSLDDINELKKKLVSLFNETFSKQLISTAQTQDISDKGFAETLLRRIRCLIQFVPTN